MLMPANWVRPVAAADVDEWVVVVVVTDVDEWVVVVVVTAVLLELAVPGRHCEYQAFEYVQTYPLIHVVAPVHPNPPPASLVDVHRSWLNLHCPQAPD